MVLVGNFRVAKALILVALFVANSIFALEANLS